MDLTKKYSDFMDFLAAQPYSGWSEIHILLQLLKEWDPNCYHVRSHRGKAAEIMIYQE